MILLLLAAIFYFGTGLIIAGWLNVAGAEIVAIGFLWPLIPLMACCLRLYDLGQDFRIEWRRRSRSRGG